MRAPRFMIAAPASGSGKTLVTCGILQALVNRGLKTASFKCGPDYIDPMFHSRIIGARSKNLDAFFVEEDTLRYLFAKGADGCDVSVIEGVMGFYDGVTVDGSRASSYDVSMKTRTPVILLIDCRGASLSVLATLKGFLGFRENRIAGVIFNRMSEKVFRTLAPRVEEMGVRPIGYVPKMDDLVLESRHLGLVLPDEVADLKDKLNRMAAILEETLDIDAMLELAERAEDITAEAPPIPRIEGEPRVGLADDEAFCFIYEDNVDILRRMGAEIVRFSPLKDERLPDVDGIILPGGYPELHLDELEKNVTMRESIREALAGGMPCMAECGGFMYLHDSIVGSDGTPRRMCGTISGEVRDERRLVRFGYATFRSPDGMWARGHEFHYWDSSDCGSDWTAEKPSGRSYSCIHDDGRTVAGFPHLYYYSNPELPMEFLRRCLAYRNARALRHPLFMAPCRPRF